MAIKVKIEFEILVPEEAISKKDYEEFYKGKEGRDNLKDLLNENLIELVLDPINGLLGNYVTDAKWIDAKKLVNLQPEPRETKIH